MRVIEGRRKAPEEGSYTNKLLEGGDNRILKKIGEESAEFVMACKDNDADEIAGEAADILFHMQVALAYHGVSWRKCRRCWRPVGVRHGVTEAANRQDSGHTPWWEHRLHRNQRAGLQRR